MSSLSKLRITREGQIKLTFSIVLVVCSIIVSIIDKNFIFTAMLLSFGGDVFLMKNGNCFYNKSDKDFGIGVFLFMLSHVNYARFMATDVTETIRSLMLCIVVMYFTSLTFGLKHKIAISAIYVVVLILSVVNTYHYNAIAFAGGLLFLISDFSIGIFDILKRKDLLREFVVWGTYISAQILLMSSVCFT